MDGYLLDTNAVSTLWNLRHPDHTTLTDFLQERSESLVWVSVIALGEIEYGLKIAPQMDENSQNEVRMRMSEYAFLEVNKHTVESYSDLRSALFKKYSPRSRRGRLKMKWPEDLCERTTSKELGVQENDIWIAAQAVQYNLILVSNDSMRRIQEVSADFEYSFQLASWK
ncbi:toxin-antitoxin system, toxin component, PIN family [delta proteobacterium NaphS2]|nr:toxin-antitoxin system, toxin component, PIN family [delta proteobacterium NaphS2]